MELRELMKGVQWVTHFGSGCGQCYDFSRKPKIETYDVGITSIVLVFHHPIIVLFDLGFIFSYVSIYFDTDIDDMYEFLAMPIPISTLLEDSLVVDRCTNFVLLPFWGMILGWTWFFSIWLILILSWYKLVGFLSCCFALFFQDCDFSYLLYSEVRI